MNLIYKGDVDVTISHKKRKLKNNGTEYLFKIFTHMVTGGVVPHTMLPCYLMLYKRNQASICNSPLTEEHTGSELLTNFVILHKYTINEDSTYAAVFDTNITPEYKASLSVSRDEPITLALISQDKTSILAAVPFEYDDYTYLESGNSAIIKWTIYLTNEAS